MTRPTELRTERLILRPFRLSDIDAVHEYASDPEWATYYLRPYDRGRAEYVVAQAVLSFSDKGAAFAVVYDGRVIGLVSLRVDPEDEDRKAELGYDIARDMWGRGMAHEAAAAVCDWAFREYELASIYALADARNRRSLRVMEKLGMTREATHRSDEVENGERVDGACYSVLRSEWSGPGGPLAPAAAPPEEYGTTQRDDIPELTTPRLLLRPFVPADVDDIFEYAKDPEWGEFLLDSVPQPYTRRSAEEFIASRMTAPRTELSWAIVLRGTGIGGIVLRVDSKHETGEIDYALAKSHWGQGLMPEAAAAVVDWAFRERGLARISSQANVRNRRSWRVMEKIGMRREGVSRSRRKDPRPGHPRIDMAFYGLLREEWERTTDGGREAGSG